MQRHFASGRAGRSRDAATFAAIPRRAARSGGTPAQPPGLRSVAAVAAASTRTSTSAFRSTQASSSRGSGPTVGWECDGAADDHGLRPSGGARCGQTAPIQARPSPGRTRHPQAIRRHAPDPRATAAPDMTIPLPMPASTEAKSVPSSWSRSSTPRAHQAVHVRDDVTDDGGSNASRPPHFRDGARPDAWRAGRRARRRRRHGSGRTATPVHARVRRARARRHARARVCCGSSRRPFARRRGFSSMPGPRSRCQPRPLHAAQASCDHRAMEGLPVGSMHSERRGACGAMRAAR